jgi:hypothetical protein
VTVKGQPNVFTINVDTNGWPLAVQRIEADNLRDALHAAAALPLAAWFPEEDEE